MLREINLVGCSYLDIIDVMLLTGNLDLLDFTTLYAPLIYNHFPILQSNCHGSGVRRAYAS
jgi:hypothetical protein